MSNQNILCSLMCVLCASFAVRGAEVPEGYEYRPLVEEGKTWWYGYDPMYITGFDMPRRCEFGIRIEGDTIADGKVWKKCMFVKDNLEIHPIPMALIREEDKRVYYTHSMTDDDAAAFPMPNILGMMYGYRFRDVAIYDFNLGAGDSYDVGRVTDEDAREAYSSIFDWHSVRNISYVTNCGNVYRTYGFRAWGKAVIEGIGDCFGGLFFCPFAEPTDENPLMMECSLRWVTDAAGDILYEDKGGLKLWDLPEPEVPDGYVYRPFVQEGKTWWCFTSTSRGVESRVRYEYGVTMQGDTVVDGMLWKKCMLVEPGMKQACLPVGLMREHEGHVFYYDLLDSYKDMPDFPPSYLEETMIQGIAINPIEVYDFTLQEGENYRYHLFPVAVGGIKYIFNSGNMFRGYTIGSAPDAEPVCLEGIGAVSPSDFFMTPFALRLECADPSVYGLRWVTDPDGKILYEQWGGVKLWEADGVDDVKVLGGLELRAAGAEVWIAGAAEACVAVADMAGRTVAESVMAAGARLSLADLPAGVYVVTAVADDGSRATVKLVRS